MGEQGVRVQRKRLPLPYFEDISAILREQSLPLRHEAPERAAPGPEPLLLTTFDTQRANRTGIIVTVLLHVLVVLIAYYQPKAKITPKQGREGNAIAYIAMRPPTKVVPPEVKPVPVKTVRVTTPRPHKPRPPAPRPEIVEIERLPDTITPPIPLEPAQPAPAQPPEMAKVDPLVDMATGIAARQRARQRASGITPQETDLERGQRLVRANVAAANRGSGGADDDGTGGLFSVTPRSMFSALLTFRGYNVHYDRRWRQEVEVELGSEPDIETAVVHKMIELIRKEKKGNFTFRSDRENRDIPVSAHPTQLKKLEQVLFREFFPEHARSK